MISSAIPGGNSWRSSLPVIASIVSPNARAPIELIIR
jgi:hypothetical protein